MASQSFNVSIVLADEAEPDELDRATRQLRDEIEELDVAEARLAAGTHLPAGAKGDPITIGGIVVTLGSAGVFTGLIGLIKAWALRHQGRTVTLKAKVGDREVELAYSPASTSPQEMTEFVQSVVSTLGGSGQPANS